MLYREKADMKQDIVQIKVFLASLSFFFVVAYDIIALCYAHKTIVIVFLFPWSKMIDSLIDYILLIGPARQAWEGSRTQRTKKESKKEGG